MKIILFLCLFFAVPLIWDASSSASANRGVQAPATLPAMMIQIRVGAVSNQNAEAMKPGDSLYFSGTSRSDS